jgi:DNA-binding PadR family transcriptional regulator
MREPDFQQLPRSAVYILIAIGPNELHGYAVMSEIERITDGSVRMAPGTLYTSIKRLMDAGLLEEANAAVDPAPEDERRRYYRLTPRGLRAAKLEVQRLRSLVTAASGWASEGRR